MCFYMWINQDRAHVSLIVSHTHDIQAQVPEGGGGIKHIRFMKNLNM
jgi:hypothetical protein